MRAKTQTRGSQKTQDQKKRRKTCANGCLPTPLLLKNALVSKDFVENAWENDNEPGIVSNGEELEANEVANMGGIPEPMPFNEKGIVNLTSVNKLIDQGFRVRVDSNA